jgi:hypothetical protein
VILKAFTYWGSKSMTDAALPCFMRELISSSDNSSSGSYEMIIISDNAKTIQAPPSTKKLLTPQRSVSSPLHPTSRWDPPSTARTATPESCHSNTIASTSSSESSSSNSPLLMLDHPSLVSTEPSPGRHRPSSSSRLLQQPVRQASLNAS